MTTVGIVVPNYNGARYLRECVDSILAQDHAGLRCLVMDGASSDESLELLGSYGDRVEVVSERDAGQSDAINKGFRRLDTDLVGWLNSDDVLLPGAIDRVVRCANDHPDAVLFHGDVELIDASGQRMTTARSREIDHEAMRRGRGRTLQPGSFYRRWAIERSGGVDPSFYLLMDVDLWTRLLALGPAVRIDGTLARFRVHAAAKSSEKPYRYYWETLRLGWLHERDQIARALARRVARIGVYHASYMVGLGTTQSRLRASSARRVVEWIWKHPNNQGRRISALGRFASWQAYKRALRRPLVIDAFDGARLLCEPDSTAVAALIYTHGCSDFEEMRFVSDYLRPGDRFVDVGANEGVYSVLAATRVGSGGRVDAFEPDPTSGPRLAANVALNGFEHVHVHRVAVGDHAGSVEFVSGLGSMSHMSSGGEEAAVVREVPLVTLDSALAGDYALGKIDIEGAEVLALRGAPRHLAAQNPPVWVAEINWTCERFGFTPSDVAAAWAEAGYALATYDPKTRSLHYDRDAWKHNPNVIAVSRTRRAFVEARLAARRP